MHPVPVCKFLCPLQHIMQQLLHNNHPPSYLTYKTEKRPVLLPAYYCIFLQKRINPPPSLNKPYSLTKPLFRPASYS